MGGKATGEDVTDAAGVGGVLLTRWWVRVHHWRLRVRSAVILSLDRLVLLVLSYTVYV